MEVREPSAKYLARRGYKQTEVGVIPEDWEVPKLESIISEISMGPFGSDIKVSNFVSDGVPVLNGANVRSERLRDSFANFVSPAKAKSLKKAVAHRGDIVVTHRGTLGQISYIPENSAFDRYVISQSQFRVRFIESLVTPSWVVLYFHSEQGAESLLEGKGHTGVPAIAQPTKTFRHLHIPLPSLSEQRDIAEALSDADAFIELLEQLLAKKRHLKQGAMQELLTGKKRLPGFSGEWEVTRIGELLKYERPDKYIVKSVEYHDNATTPVLTANKSFVLGYTNEDFGIYKDWPVIIFDDFTTDSKYVDFPFKVKSSAIKILRTKSTEINLKFVHERMRLIDFPLGEHKRYYISEYQRLEIPMPRSDEQTVIAAILSDMDAEIAVLEAKLTKARSLKQGMMQELLTGRIRLI
jgi:type I restriction enzyme S subunit